MDVSCIDGPLVVLSRPAVPGLKVIGRLGMQTLAPVKDIAGADMSNLREESRMQLMKLENEADAS